MHQIVPDVYLLDGLRMAHVYLLASDDGLTLIDAGTPGETDRIVTQIEEEGYELSDLRAIVLTHCHADHTGSVAELARRSGAQVLAHQAEVPYVEQTEPLPAASSVRRLFNWLSDRAFGTEPCPVDRPLQDGDVVKALGGLRVIHAPGHTPGSIALYQPQRRILFTGDVLFNAHPLRGKAGLQFPPRIFSLDQEQAEASARELAGLELELICFGHGEPILEGAQEKLRAALERPA
jgi:glyoxylase-like metal-dependent hydrolase (beta-lactamase superfamily II)